MTSRAESSISSLISKAESLSSADQSSFDSILDNMMNDLKTVAIETSGPSSSTSKYLDSISREIDEKRRVRQERHESKGKMTEVLDQLLPLATDELLLVETISSYERAILHSWAATRGFSHHIPIETNHFWTCWLYTCENCETTFDTEQICEQTDYGAFGHPSGMVYKCPDCFDTFMVVNYGPSDNHECGLTRKSIPNALLICTQLPENLPEPLRAYQQEKVSIAGQRSVARQLAKIPLRRIQKQKLFADLKLSFVKIN